MNKEKCFIDLSKLSYEQLRIVRMTLYKNREYVPFFTNLFEIDRYYKLYCDKGDWLCGDVMFNEKTEILYPEFIKLFEGGDGENELEVWLNRQIEKCQVLDMPREEWAFIQVLKKINSNQ